MPNMCYYTKFCQNLPNNFGDHNFLIFKIVTVGHLEFSKFQIFSRHSVGRPVSITIPNFTKLGQQFSKWQPSAILDFFKIQFLSSQCGLDGQCLPPCKISSRLAKRFWRYHNFSVFKMTAIQPSWIFKVNDILRN